MQRLSVQVASPILGRFPDIDTAACKSLCLCPPSMPPWPAYVQPSMSAELRSKI
jgi:hypothetical protein